MQNPQQEYLAKELFVFDNIGILDDERWTQPQCPLTRSYTEKKGGGEPQQEIPRDWDPSLVNDHIGIFCDEGWTTTVPPDSQLHRKERGGETTTRNTLGLSPLPMTILLSFTTRDGHHCAPWLAATQERKGTKNHNKEYLGIESLVDDHISIFYDEEWTPLCPLTRGHTVPWPHDLVRRLAIWQRQPLWAVDKYTFMYRYMNIHSRIRIAARFGPSSRHLAVVAVLSYIWIRTYKYKYNHMIWSVVSQSGSGSFEQFKIIHLFINKNLATWYGPSSRHLAVEAALSYLYIYMYIFIHISITRWYGPSSHNKAAAAA